LSRKRRHACALTANISLHDITIAPAIPLVTMAAMRLPTRGVSRRLLKSNQSVQLMLKSREE